MLGLTRKKILDAALKTLLAIVETSVWIKAPATFISEISQKVSDLPEEQRSALKDANAQEIRHALNELSFIKKLGKTTFDGMLRIEENIKYLQETFNKSSLNNRSTFGIGVLAGAMLEASFVLNHIDSGSEMHLHNMEKFGALIRKEGKNLDLEDVTKELAISLEEKSDLKHFFFNVYPSYCNVLSEKLGNEPTLYFQMALSMQDLNIAMNEARVSLETNNTKFLKVVKGRVDNSAERLRTILQDINLNTSIKHKLLELLMNMECATYSTLSEIESFSKQLGIIMHTTSVSI